MTGLEISIGTYPGILLGIRSYHDTELGKTDHVIYLPFVDICISVTKE